jgi:hypothetical protein
VTTLEAGRSRDWSWGSLFSLQSQTGAGIYQASRPYGTACFIHGRKAGEGVTLTTDLPLVSRLISSGF